MKSRIEMEHIEKLAVAYRKEEKEKILSMDFHLNGEGFVYNTAKHLIYLSLEDEVRPTSFVLNKGPADLVKFFDREHVIHTSTIDHRLKILNIFANGYYRYYPGHSEAVVSVDSTSDFLISSSEDTTVRIWNPNEQKQIREKRFHSTPYVAIMPESNVFFVLFKSPASSYTILCFDLRKLDKETFKFEFKVDHGTSCTGLKFSPNGTSLMILTNTSNIYVIEVTRKVLSVNFKGLSMILLYQVSSLSFLNLFLRLQERKQPGDRRLLFERLSLRVRRKFRWNVACLGR
jgi:WD40 repeat protein